MVADKLPHSALHLSRALNVEEEERISYNEIKKSTIRSESVPTLVVQRRTIDAILRVGIRRPGRWEKLKNDYL